jgi:hypothetical protein
VAAKAAVRATALFNLPRAVKVYVAIKALFKYASERGRFAAKVAPKRGRVTGEERRRAVALCWLEVNLSLLPLGIGIEQVCVAWLGVFEFSTPY